jgi:hypothetical protein
MNRGEEDMTKTVLMNGAHLVLAQVALMSWEMIAVVLTSISIAYLLWEILRR